MRALLGLGVEIATFRSIFIRNCARNKSTADPNWAGNFHKAQIPRDLLTIKFLRSSGPGGQNVNKVSTKVELRFALASAQWLPEFVKEKLQETEGNRVNKAGEFILTSDRYRTQPENLEDAISKLHEIVTKAGYVPKEASPETKARIAANIRRGKAADRAAKQLTKHKKSDRSSWRE